MGYSFDSFKLDFFGFSKAISPYFYVMNSPPISISWILIFKLHLLLHSMLGLKKTTTTGIVNIVLGIINSSKNEFV